MIHTFPSSPFQWIFLIPITLISLSWIIDGSLWSTILNYIKNTSASESNLVKVIVHPVSILMLTLNYAVSGILLVHVIKPIDSIWYLSIVISAFIGIPLFLIMCSFLVKSVSVRSNFFSFYISNIYFSITLFGIAFYLASLFYYYIPSYKIEFLIGLISLVFLINLFRIIITLVRAIEFKFSLFYIILYFCTLEILPFIVVLSILNG